jgi:hypothetical protein
LLVVIPPPLPPSYLSSNFVVFGEGII